MTLRFNPSSSHTTISPVSLVNDHDEAYELWRAAGIRNQVLLHFDAHIDFEWIAEKDPLNILEQKPLKEALREFRISHGWSFGNAVNNFTHLGNYIYRALQDGMVKRWYWVVPDAIWENPLGRRQIWRDLLDYYQYRTGPMEFPTKGAESFTASFLDIPFEVIPFKNLPHFGEPVLLNIDVDFLTTGFSENIPSPQILRRQLPWIWPGEFAAKLKRSSVTPVMTTLANSVQGGFTPIQFKFLGETLRDFFLDEEISSAYDFLKEAIQLRSDGKISASLNRLDAFESQGVYEATRQFLRAQCLYDLSEPAQAAAAMAEAVSADAEFGSGYASYAKYYETLGRHEEAYEEHRRVRTLLPEQIEAKIGEADLCIREKKLSQAYDILRKIFIDHPASAAAVQRLGDLLKIQGDWIKASIYYELAVQLNPKDLISRMELGRCLLRQGRLEEAKICLREALGAGAHYPGVYFLLSDTYRKLGLIRKSLELRLEGLRLKFKIWVLRFKK